MKPSPYPSTHRRARPSGPSCADRRIGPAVRWCTGLTAPIGMQSDRVDHPPRRATAIATAEGRRFSTETARRDLTNAFKMVVPLGITQPTYVTVTKVTDYVGFWV